MSNVRNKIKQSISWITQTRLYREFRVWGRKFTLPGFEKMPIYDVVQFFFHGIRKSSLLSRANSLSFTFTLAIFPMILFFFTLIPYVPVAGLQESILNALSNVLPDQVYSFLHSTITEIVSKQSGGWLSLGFFMAFYFSNSGVIGIMKAFNRSAHAIETRSWWKMHMVSLGLQLILITIILIAAALLIFTPIFLHYISENSIVTSGFAIIMIQIAKWLILALLVFLSLSFIYYLAPAGKRVFRFISPGSMLATILALIFIALFNLYIDHFAQYNKLYGSIGTIIILMLYININAIALLIGFELNASIYDAQMRRRKE
ncbi:MAG: YihY/virulence factor BrkB family protein [Bacteroidetes bacterium]|nr:MAG: YihY/virulence factor BrkB family protein [Bacteroidota bacterium]